MNRPRKLSQTSQIHRREFFGSALRASTGAAVAFSTPYIFAAAEKKVLEVGQGTVDVTPPLGVELAGFHRPPGHERRATGIRQPAAARALVLRMRDTQVAIVSLDMLSVGQDMVRRVQQRVAELTGIAAENVRLCVSHSHSMPSLCYLRQWGAVPTQYMADVERKIAQAVQLAMQDLAPAELFLGKSRAAGGNHNRTRKEAKTDALFTAESTEQERWLDTMLHALRFERPAGKPALLWYHFSAHPVCFADEQAGPDFPGMVAERLHESRKLSPSFLQGHAGDVNPGDGTPWRGDAEETTSAVYDALCRAIDGATRIDVDQLRMASRNFQVPLDMALFKAWLNQYEKNPAECHKGKWVDAGFAKDWYAANKDADLGQTHLPRTLNAMQLGPVGLVFHPSELYSYYGLAIRRDSPLDDTLVVGYADGMIGYLPDRQAYESGEYSALTVPKILDYAPFTPTAAAETSQALVALLKAVVG